MVTTSCSHRQIGRQKNFKKQSDRGVSNQATFLSVAGQRRASKALNTRLHWGKRGIVYQHEPRQVDVLVKDLGLDQGNSVQTPATHDVTEEEPEPLDQVQQS